TGFCGPGVVWAPRIGMRAVHKLMGHNERARTAFDAGPPAFIPLYRGNPWSTPGIIQSYRMQDRSRCGAPAADSTSPILTHLSMQHRAELRSSFDCVMPWDPRYAVVSVRIVRWILQRPSFGIL